MPTTQMNKLKKSELAFALFRSEATSCAVTRRATVQVFANFLENKSRSEQKEYTTFIRSSWSISDRKVREINFPACSTFFRGFREQNPKS